MDIYKQINKIKKMRAGTYKTKIQKLTAFFLVMMFLLPPTAMWFTPRKAAAVLPVADTTNPPFSILNVLESGVSAAKDTWDALDEIAKQVLKTVARRALQEMTKSTVNWINGVEGRPLFVGNSRSFFGNIAEGEIKKIVDSTGYDKLRLPFGRQLALELIGAYRAQSNANAQYTLSRVINDPELLQNYRNDFGIGGWNGFMLHTQYPENNYVGSKLLASEKLGQKLANLNTNVAADVREELQQGMGFLSLKICPSNPSFPKDIDPNNPPAFNYATYGREHPYNPPKREDYKDQQLYNIALSFYDNNYNTAKVATRNAWNKKNTCPGGLKTTTPGAVAANSIMDALGGPRKLGEWSAALGNSLSAVFDAFANKYLQKGLRYLTSKVNPAPPPDDDWNYEGTTLGSPLGNINDDNDWTTVPDEEIDLNNFIEEVNEGIENTTTELALMDSSDTANPGIKQLITIIPRKAKELDECLPGPDMGWESRLDKEFERNAKVLREKAQDNPEANNVLRELRYAVEYFKDWVELKTSVSLPNGTSYLKAIKDVKRFAQQSKELEDKQKNKTQARTRLMVIQEGLDAIKESLGVEETQPAKNTPAERHLISYRRNYNAVRDFISTTTTVANSESERDILNDSLIKLNTFISECGNARTVAGWTNPGGSAAKLASGPNKAIDKEFGVVDNLMAQHYRETLDRPPVRTEPPLRTTYPTFDEPYTKYIFKMLGTEIEQFCLLPVDGGFPHGTVLGEDEVIFPVVKDAAGKILRPLTYGGASGYVFEGRTEPILYPDLPMINSPYVFKYREQRKWKRDKDRNVHIAIVCEVVWKSSIIDYTNPEMPSF